MRQVCKAHKIDGLQQWASALGIIKGGPEEISQAAFMLGCFASAACKLSDARIIGNGLPAAGERYFELKSPLTIF